MLAFSTAPFEKFLSLWIALRKDADLGIAEVENARKWLASLQEK